jgi:GNAT superfamily N-acetyltransferase
MEQWQMLVQDSGQDGKARVIIVELEAGFNSQALGYAVWQRFEGDFLLLRLGVVKQHRRRGIGQLLFDTVLKDARKRNIPKIKVTIPEIYCLPGDPDDVSAFLSSMGFRATGEILTNWKFMFGKTYDGILWEYLV